MTQKLQTKFRKLCRSTAAVALPVTFLLLLVTTLGIVAFTYYFAVERINAQGQTLKVSTAKQDFLSLDDAVTSTLWQPGSSRKVDISDNNGRLNVQPNVNNLQLGITYGTQISYDRYNPLNYALLGSTTLSSGTVADLQSDNGDYMSFQSAYSATETNTYYPSAYTLLGSTRVVSGSVSDLQADDTNYMSLRSYVSATSATAKTDAFIAYRDSSSLGLTYPKTRDWDGDTAAWGSSGEMPNAGSNVRWFRTAICPISARALEKIVVTLSDDGYLDAYVFDGTSWTVTSDIANVGTTANQYRCFDVEYERTSGEALLVYSHPPSSNFAVGYKTWSPSSGWSSESTYTIVAGTAQTAYWISMAPKPTSGADELAVGVIGDSTQLDSYGLIWNGSSFSSQRLLTGTVSIATRECIAVAYEQTSGYATFVSSTATNAFSWQWSGSAWDAAATTFDLTGTQTPGWFTLKANPGSDELLAVSVDQQSDLNTAYWSGSTWTLHTEHDGTVDIATARPADFAWDRSGSTGILVWGTAANNIAYKIFSSLHTWGTQQSASFTGGTHPWVQLRTNPRNIADDVDVLGVVVDATNFDIGAIQWDTTNGLVVIGSSTISSSITVNTYECFDLQFQRFGDPTEFTASAEFTGSSDTQSLIHLLWSLVSQTSTTATTATLQLYNYQTSQYPASGEGYITGSIGTSDTTLSQNITSHPTYFRDGSGDWAMKLIVSKSTSQQFDWNLDLSEYSTVHVTEETCEVEFIGASNLASWTSLICTTDLVFDTTDVATQLQLFNYTASQYPSSENGYITDVLGQTDKTETQSILINPTDFRDPSGDWKIKITATKATDAPFELSVDLVEFAVTAESGGQTSFYFFNSTIGQITYELPYLSNPDIGLYIKGDERTITNQSGASISQVGIQSGAEYSEVFLSYRPKVLYAVTGVDSSNRVINDIRVYIVNFNSSEPLTSYGKLPLKILCQSTIKSTTTYTIPYAIDNAFITSTMRDRSDSVLMPISSTPDGAVIHVETVISYVQIGRATV